jgi:LacI family transcriptional regulator
VLRRPFGGRAGYEALDTLLAGPNPPTALFVTSDLAALGLLRAATDRGLRVPDDLAVASFDGIEYAAYTTPGLTTAEQPIFEMGRRAAELLVGALASESRPTGLQKLPTRLTIRGSCGCPDTFVRSSNALLGRTTGTEPG